MTPKEAAEKLRMWHVGEGYIQARAMGIEALERFTPKKPNGKTFSGDEDLYVGYCPTCRSDVNSEDDFCYRCGQALDWEHVQCSECLKEYMCDAVPDSANCGFIPDTIGGKK